MSTIRIQAGNVNATATLDDTQTARLILDALPIHSTTRVWGDEIYFDIPVHDEECDAQATVPSGTLAFWPPGDCFCIFFGQTPASPVNVVGTLDSDPKEFARVKPGEPVTMEKAE